MEITIRRPLGYSQIGRKDQQEDAVWPLFADVTSNNRCIVLCDGVGGSEHGEVASQTSSKVIGEYLTGIIAKSNYVCDEDVQDAVNMAYDKLEQLDTETSENGTVSMATTLTCVCFHSDGVLAAHMGDSRIYHVRPGQGVLYESRDHSLVRTLLDAGEITEEEAKTFRRKNVITKAIQPHGTKRFRAEVKLLSDIRSGDYLFLCCDGVLDQLTVGRLFQILSMNCSDEEKLALLEAESTDKTKDNYTAYLIPIDNVEGESSLPLEEEVSVDVDEITVVGDEPETKIELPCSSIESDVSEARLPNNTKKKFPVRNIVTTILILLLIILLAKFFTAGTNSKDSPNAPSEQIDSTKKDITDSTIQMIVSKKTK